MGNHPVIDMDETPDSDYDAVYFCGVSKKGYIHNVHLVVRPCNRQGYRPMQIIFLLGHCLSLIYAFIGFNRLMETINSLYHSVSTNIFLCREKNLEIFFLYKEKY